MTASPHIIVCLDLALANTGVAVIAVSLPTDSLLQVETIHTEKTDKTTMRKAKMRTSEDEWRRTSELCAALRRVLVTHRPAHVFIECPTGGSKSATAARSMAVARGAACAVLHSVGVPVTLVTPFEAKKAATGDHTASKDQVKQAALKQFPEFTGWVRGKRGTIVQGLNEHVYDAISVYMAAQTTTHYKELKNDKSKQR